MPKKVYHYSQTKEQNGKFKPFRDDFCCLDFYVILTYDARGERQT